MQNSISSQVNAHHCEGEHCLKAILASFTASSPRSVIFWGPRSFWKTKDSDWKVLNLPLEYVPDGEAFPGCMLATETVAAVKNKMSFMLEDWKSKPKFVSELYNF